MTTDIHTCDWQALLWRCSSSKNEEGETVSAADAELHLGQSRDQWGEVDHVFNILYKTVIIITATYHHQMSRCISMPGPWRQSDGPTSNIGYGFQIRRSNDTSTGWVKKKCDLKKFKIALSHSILKLKSIVIPLNQMSQSGEKHAQD